MRIRNWARMTGAAAAMALMLGGAAMATNLPVSADISNTCAIGTVTALSFTYDPVVTNATTESDAQGNIALTCTSGDASIVIGLTLGANAASGQRYMKDTGTDTLSYNLYKDTYDGAAWDDSSNKLDAPTGTGVSQNIPVYGVIPAGQNKPAGHYTDTVTIDLTY
jgi:spore coat protein U-like protein